MTVDKFTTNVLRFRRCCFDTCNYIRKSDGTILALYVDNMLLMGSNEAVAAIHPEIAACFDIVYLSPVTDFLGVVVERDRPNHTIYLQQRSYI
jgi:hypothetical protein